MATPFDFNRLKNLTPVPLNSQTLTVPDGRQLSFSTYGSPPSLGRVIFYFHGFPSCQIEANMAHHHCTVLNIHMVAITRPGFHTSSFQENRTLLDWSKDVLAVADHLGIESFGILGVSGGGPYVLACLRDIAPERCKAGAIVASIYPTKLGLAGMMLKTRILMWIAPYATGLIDTALNYAMGNAARDTAHPEKFEDLMRQDISGGQFPPIDKERMLLVLENEVLKVGLVESIRESVRTSTRGAAWELKLYSSDWGFELEEVDGRRLSIWHGALDVNAPVGMADRAADLINGSEYHRMEDKGHFSMAFDNLQEILKELVNRMEVTTDMPKDDN